MEQIGPYKQGHSICNGSFDFNSIDCISNELLQHIFSWLTTPDLKSCQLVSKSWKRLSDDHLPIVIECEDKKLLVTKEIAEDLKEHSRLLYAAFLIAQEKQSRNINLKTVPVEDVDLFLDMIEGKNINDAKTIFKLVQVCSVLDSIKFNKNPETVIPHIIHNLKRDFESFQLVKEFYKIAASENYPKIIQAARSFFSRFLKECLFTDEQLLLKAAEELKEINNLNDGLQLHLSLTNALCSSFSDVYDHHMENLKALSAVLASLDLESCYNITDEGLLQLAPLTNLHKLDLSYLLFEGISHKGFQVFQHLTNLSYLNLTYCKGATDKGLKQVNALPHLDTLILKDCLHLTEKGLRHLNKNSSLTYLDLSNSSQISDKALKEVNFVRQLQFLNLYGCSKITDRGLENIRSLSRLKMLNLGKCYKITDAGLEKGIKFLTSLADLDLSWCTNITDRAFAALASLHSLSNLSLQSCPSITYKGLRALKDLESLTSMDLRWCKLKDKDLKGLKLYKNLKTLHVEDFSGRLKYLKSIDSLSTLLLKNSPFKIDNSASSLSDQEIEDLAPLTGLRQLNLFGNQLITDKAIDSILSLISLTTLDLAYTQITDKGVKKLTALTGLKRVNLSHCPITVEGLKVLEPLKLSWLNVDGCEVSAGEIGKLKSCHASVVNREDLEKDNEKKTYNYTQKDYAQFSARRLFNTLSRRLKERIPALKKSIVFQKDSTKILLRFEFTDPLYCKRLISIFSRYCLSTAPVAGNERQLILMRNIDENLEIKDFDKTISSLIRDFFEFQEIPSPRSLSAPAKLPARPSPAALPRKGPKPKPKARTKKEIETESIQQKIGRRNEEKSQKKGRSLNSNPKMVLAPEPKKGKRAKRNSLKATTQKLVQPSLGNENTRPILPLSQEKELALPPRLEEGIKYEKEKDIIAPIKRKADPLPHPTTGQIPEFNPIQLKNLDAAIDFFENLEHLVGTLFGKNPPAFKELPLFLRRPSRRKMEYFLLKAFEAIDPTSKSHPLKEDKEYLSKLNICLGSLDDLRNIRNRIRSDFLSIGSEEIFKLAIELVKRNPSAILKNLKETKLPTQTNTLKRALAKSWGLGMKKPKIKNLLKTPPSMEKDLYLSSLMGKEFEIISFSFKAGEDESTFYLLNKNLPSIKMGLANIQKLYTYLTKEKKQTLNKDPSFQTILKMGKKVAHEIPENLIVAMGEEIPREDIYHLMMKDPYFFKNIFTLIGYDESICKKQFRKNQVQLLQK